MPDRPRRRDALMPPSREPAKLTDARAKALEYLSRVTDGPASADVARALWPASPAWRKSARRHDQRAGAHGAGLIMSAGAFLGRMSADGLVSHRTPSFARLWYITDYGARSLAAYRAKQEASR